MSLALESPQLTNSPSKYRGGPSAAATDAELLRRFIERRDDVAFEELVARHAALVMGVCRRTLGNAHDAEDAFQATFLVLARKASSVRRSKSLSSWLYKTAYRIALKARRRSAGRKEQPLKDETMIATESFDQIAADYDRSALDEELNRLPERYRLPVMLCCLEGKSREEAARQLGWSLGSLKGRLERARQLLSRRLVLRGVTLSMALAAVQLCCRTTQAAVPGSLIVVTAQAGSQYAAGQAAAGYVSHNALSLANGVIHAMTLSTLKVAACSLLLVGTVAVASRAPVAATSDAADIGEIVFLQIQSAADDEEAVALGPAAALAISAVAAEGENQDQRTGKPDKHAKFVSADKTQNVIFVLESAGEGSQIEKTLDLAKDAEILIDLGKPAELADLKEGNELQLWLSADRSQVEAVHAKSSVRFGRWRGRDPGNVPKAIDLTKSTITFQGGEGRSEDHIFPIAPDAQVRIGQKVAKLADLTTEHRVLITLSVDDKTVVQITQLGRDGE